MKLRKKNGTAKKKGGARQIQKPKKPNTHKKGKKPKESQPVKATRRPVTREQKKGEGKENNGQEKLETIKATAETYATETTLTGFCLAYVVFKAASQSQSLSPLV